MSEFQREERYVVIKLSHLSSDQKAVLGSLGSEFQLPSVEAVVVESDWPEYEPVWRMIERRMTGLPDELAALREELASAKRDVERYRALRKVTPYRFKKMQEASVTDGGDVLYFHADKFDVLMDIELAKPTESGESE